MIQFLDTTTWAAGKNPGGKEASGESQAPFTVTLLWMLSLHLRWKPHLLLLHRYSEETFTIAVLLGASEQELAYMK